MEMEKLLATKCMDGKLPDKLRGRDDCDSQGFIHHSIVERLSAIVKVADNCEDIATDLKAGKFIVKPVTDGFEPSWDKFIEQELKESPSGHCLDVSWFFLENYMYRYCLSRTKYFDKNAPSYLQDPWEQSKMESLASALPSFLTVARDANMQSFEQIVLCCLWGNRSDLSLSSGTVDSKVASGAAGRLLVDDVRHVESYLEKQPVDNKIVLVLDNCGAELLADLRLALHLSARFKVTLHCKSHPVFVSDATPRNIDQHLVRLEEAKCELAGELRKAFQTKRITVLSDSFYTSPLEFWQLPNHLKKSEFEQACLVILKGDANYRRMLLDRHFPHELPFETICAVTTSIPIFAIRTCKSPIIVGIPKEIEDSVSALDANWCTNGTCGTLQFTHSTVDQDITTSASKRTKNETTT